MHPCLLHLEAHRGQADLCCPLCIGPAEVHWEEHTNSSWSKKVILTDLWKFIKPEMRRNYQNLYSMRRTHWSRRQGLSTLLRYEYTVLNLFEEKMKLLETKLVKGKAKYVNLASSVSI